MKKLLLALLPALLLVTLLLGGMPVMASQPPAPPQPNNEVRVTEGANGGRVELKGGAVLAVSLESNPSTGYGWQVQGLNTNVLRMAGEDWISQSPGLFGAPGTLTLRFAGVTEGQAQLNLVYSRSWEKNVPPMRTFSLQVQVVAPAAVESSVDLVQSQPAPAKSVLTALPTAYNWCNYGGCTPVRDQGSCGSCWAFGTVGPLESAILIKDGVSKDLSEQYLVSCNEDGWSCNGGWWAHDYHAWKIPASETAAGAVYESAFPYQATDVPCAGPYTHNEKIADWVYIGSETGVAPTDAIKQAIYTYGPVSAGVCVNTAFQTYTGGVFAPTKPCTQINHAIVLVGWDDSTSSWVLRNSWGPSWGENGYMRIAYGASQVGYAANYVVYGSTVPTPTPIPTPPPSNSMHVSAINMSFTHSGSNHIVYTTVTIVDANNVAVPNATVSIKTTLPSGATSTGSAVTGTNGQVTFSVKSKLTGTYTSEVTGVTHASYVYDPAANVETRDSLIVP